MIMIHDDDHIIGQAARIAAHIMTSRLAQLSLASNAESTIRFSNNRACSLGKTALEAMANAGRAKVQSTDDLWRRCGYRLGTC
jgi:hypothetical protein